MESQQPVPPPEAEPVEEKPSLLSQLMGRGRVLAFGIALAVELAIFFGAMVYPIGPAQQQALIKQANGILGTGTQSSAGVFGAIFSNNIRVALAEMVPFAGAGILAISIFNTGQIIQALSLASTLPGPVLGMLIFIFPFAIVELSAYAIATASGSMLVFRAWRKKTFRNEAKVFVLEIGLVLLCILLAAVMETAAIVSPVVGFALWLPTAAGIFVLVIVARQHWK